MNAIILAAGIFPLVDCFFEYTPVKIPKNPLFYLDRKYPSWRDKIVFFHTVIKKNLLPSKCLKHILQ
ncbi:MAG TPA: hypothetical protein PJ990_15475 [Saprospiraceae bacterium]|nr:hypothetical protein [Saprospiraceae bacterium]